MANRLIPEELDFLIQEYLTDGILTDKERQVILKKAVGMGLDYDEIDLYLDAQVQKLAQSTDATIRKQRSKVCPHCGGSVPQYNDKCPHCGESISVPKNEELQEIIEILEEALIDFKSGKDVKKRIEFIERHITKAKLYYGSNPKIQNLIEDVQIEFEKATLIANKEARKRTIIKALAFCVILGLAVVAIWGLWRLTYEPDYLNDPQATIEAVNLALEKGDLEKAESLCDTYAQGHSENKEKRYLIVDAVDKIIDYHSFQIADVIAMGYLFDAEEYLNNISFWKGFDAYDVVEKYDPLFFSVIEAWIKKGELNCASRFAVAYRSKIGDDKAWAKSSCYELLKEAFESSGSDFSSLKSEYDNDN